MNIKRNIIFSFEGRKNLENPVRSRKRKTPSDLLGVFCGERGIRTPGASQHDGFQDRCNRPLYHLSSVRCLKSECKGSTKNEE